MKILLRILISVSSFLLLLPSTGSNLGSGCSWVITFNDHFDAKNLDTTRWSTQYPSGNNGEMQYYGLDAFSMGNSILNIYAKAIPSHGYSYTSGIIITRDNFSQQFGRFEIRAKLPKGKGFWPAFWLLPVTPHYPYEIDAFEMLGDKPNVLYMTYHWKDSNGNPTSKGFAFNSTVDYSTGFHTFMVEWDPSKIVWYVDGVQRFRMDNNTPQEPMFMLINLAVGGHWPGNPDATTKFPG